MDRVSRTRKRGKRLILALAALLILTLWWWPMLEAQGSQRGSTLKMVEVKKGETLWDIARVYGGNNDLGRAVYQIRRLNNLASSQILPGQRILVYIN